VALGRGAFLVLSPAAAQVAGCRSASGEHDSDAPVEITSDALSVDQAANTATFRGSVIVGQGTLRLAADEVEVQYVEGAEGTTEVDRITRLGRGDRDERRRGGRGANALYTVAAGQIEMEGDVIVTQGANAVSGDRLTIDLESGVANIEGRVQTVVVPGAAPVSRRPDPSFTVTEGSQGLIVKSLSKSYRRRPVLRDVSLNLHRGEVVALLGPNGAGKTTCFYAIAGLIPPDGARSRSTGAT
jgi:lipopolysaccharide export system protein LptA